MEEVVSPVFQIQDEEDKFLDRISTLDPQAERVSFDEITGFTVKFKVTTLSQPFEVWRESTYVPAVLRFCPPKAYVLPAQMEAEMLEEITGFTVKSKVMTLSQPF